MTGTVALARQLEEVVLAEDADDDRIDIARQHARGVGDGLAAAELHFGAGQHDRLAAEFAHAEVERHAGARRGPVEDHGQCLPGERTPGGRRALHARLLHRRRQVEDAPSSAADRSRRSRKCRGAAWTGAFMRSSVDRDEEALFDRGASGVETPHAFGDFLLGDDERRQQPHDIVAGGNDQNLLARSAASAKSAGGTFSLSPTIRPSPRISSMTGRGDLSAPRAADAD